MIDWTKNHELVEQEYKKRIGMGHDEARAKRKNKGAMHRLADLVPDHLPDHTTLARILVEIGVKHRGGEDYRQRAVHELYEEAKASPDGFDRLARQARKDLLAFDAVKLILDGPWHYQLRRNEDGRAEKVRIIPQPVQELIQDYYLGGFEKPKPKKKRYDPDDRHFRDGFICFLIHLASESALKPTKNVATEGKLCATDVVHEVLNEQGLDDRSVDQLMKVWQARSKAYPSNLALLDTVSDG
jgi:hypothetical protein